MRVMVWNVWWRHGADWRARENGIIATLETYRPDVLDLVECWSGDGTDQPHRLASHFGLHAAWVPASQPPAPRLPPPQPLAARLPPPRPPAARTSKARTSALEAGYPGVESGLGLLSRWPLVEVEAHEKPDALVATLDHPRGPLHVVVAGIPRHTDEHLSQARCLAALATDSRFDGPLPVLLLADLNAAPDQIELAPLQDAMVDTWTAAGADPAAVTLDGRLPIAPSDAAGQLNRRIDHVFARAGRLGLPLVVRGAFLAGDRPIDGVYPSDHYAVGVDLEP
jgi:endonuclease/exonuclease/phosphatase family metal-dependent hydrolase